MKTDRIIAAVVALLFVVGARASGQTGPDSTMSDEETPGNWQFYASLYQYIVPEDPNFAVAVFTADLDMTHFEARYNYESLQSASVHYGANFSVAGDVKFDVTPMLGVYFGKSSGFALSYRLTLGYRRFELNSEGEYVIPADKSEEKFFYSWSELSYNATEWLRAGVVAERTRIFETGLDIQRGLLAGVSSGPLEGTVYVFNVGWAKPTWVFNLAYNF